MSPTQDRSHPSTVARLEAALERSSPGAKNVFTTMFADSARKGLRAAGAIVIGKTRMTEFAFSALGTNPHDGTPGNP